MGRRAKGVPALWSSRRQPDRSEFAEPFAHNGLSFDMLRTSGRWLARFCFAHFYRQRGRANTALAEALLREHVAARLLSRSQSAHGELVEPDANSRLTFDKLWADGWCLARLRR